jgi:hypothetical protein
VVLRRPCGEPSGRLKETGVLAKICLDNCGSIPQGDLERGLQSAIHEIQRVKLVTIDLGQHDSWRAGWAVVYTDQAAVDSVLER